MILNYQTIYYAVTGPITTMGSITTSIQNS